MNTAATPQTETIADLRSALFAVLRGLTDQANPMEIDRARAVTDVAQTIVNTAKVEVDYIRAAGGKGSGFIPEQTPALPASPPLPKGVIEQRPGLTIRRNTLD